MFNSFAFFNTLSKYASAPCLPLEAKVASYTVLMLGSCNKVFAFNVANDSAKSFSKPSLNENKDFLTSKN